MEKQTSVSNFDLIVTIVSKGWGEEIVDATRAKGCNGGTIIPGRGTGINEKKKFFGILIEPEKEIVLTVIEKEKTQEVLEAVKVAGKLEQPGTGIAFVVDLKDVVGIL